MQFDPLGSFKMILEPDVALLLVSVAEQYVWLWK